jgi:plastocyanin
MRAHHHAALAAALLLTACGGGGGDGGPIVNPPTTGSIRGTVVDQTAAAVPSAAVALAATGQTTRNTTTGADGVYTFSSIPVGAWTVTVTPPTGYTLGTSTGTATVNVAGGQQANAAAITLNKTPPNNPAPATASIQMNALNFIPATAEVRVGGTVTWTNNDNVVHNATGAGFNTTGNMNPGAAVSRTMNTAGTINYSCTLHPGMTGTITVR